MKRIGVASLMQESNTFSPRKCDLADFESQGLHRGPEISDRYRGSNTEIGGALAELAHHGVEPVPLLRAWAMSSGPLSEHALTSLSALLTEELQSAGRLDGLVLSLHGAMVADGLDSADDFLVGVARSILGPRTPITVCLDLHANVTSSLVAKSDILLGYRTYPHIDLAETGGRVAHQLLRLLNGEISPVVAFAKVPMLIPAEVMQTTDGPMSELRAEADAASRTRAILEVSLFPVQPWLDVRELGFGVIVTADRDQEQADSIASLLSRSAWIRRGRFTVDLVEPSEAFKKARHSTVRPFLMTESADSPTAGAAGDSPAMVAAWLAHGRDLRTYVTVVDAPAVDACYRAGAGQSVRLSIGCTVENRYHKPVDIEGAVGYLGGRGIVLSGPGYTGMHVSMGRFAVVSTGRLSLLLTERPAITFDPATFSAAGLNPTEADVIVVRSATNYRAGFPAAAAEAVTLDLPGASTPRLDRLDFRRAPRPLFPLDPIAEGRDSWLVEMANKRP